LRDVNLTINKGDFVSFIGPSGCGKTTFLRVVAALEHPTGGEITVNGMTPDEARRNRAYGYVFQAAGLYPWRSIEKNIMLPLEIMGFDRAEQERRVKDVLQLVDLEGFGKKFPWQLSGGMQQRASIARALAFDADLLLDGRTLRRARRDRARPPERAASGAVGADGEDHRLRHALDPRGGVPLDEDRGDVAAARAGSPT
jgi:ABC-type Fe3+/spermidine/putrescine transport system ATPase subunit